MKLYKSVMRGDHPLKLFNPTNYITHKIKGLYLATSIITAWRWGNLLHKDFGFDIYEFDIRDTEVIFSPDGFYTELGMAKICKYRLAKISEILANDLYVLGLKKGPIKTFQGEFRGIGYYPALPEIILKENQLGHIRNYKKINYDPVELDILWNEKYKKYED